MHASRRESVPRVAHVITRMIRGGAQETAMLQVDGLRKRGFEVDLISGPTYGREGTALPETRSRGIDPIEIRLLRRHLNPLFDFCAWIQLIWVLRRGRYDVVHTHTSKAGVLGRVAARMVAVPLVVHTVHGWSFNSKEGWVGRLYTFAERVGAMFCDALVVVTAIDMQQGLEAGVGRREDYHVIRSGIELEKFRAPRRPPDELRRELGIPADAPVVGSVMRLNHQKAPLDWVRVAAAAATDIPTTHFVIVGDGPLLAATQAEADTLGLTERMHLVGLSDDVPDFLALFDVFLLTSHWEGLPRVIPQAMVAGLPVVATNVDGNAEAVRPEETGLLAEKGDVATLRMHLVRLITDPGEARSMGERARTRAVEYDAETMIDDTASLYRTLLGPDQG